MKTMYKLGCEPIGVHDSQIENAKFYGWSLEQVIPKIDTTKAIKKTKGKDNGKS